MNFLKRISLCSFLLSLATLAPGQEGEKDVPLMTPSELDVIKKKAQDFNQALTGTLDNAAKSTVRIWSRSRRNNKPVLLTYGTVVENGSKILTKWSEIERFADLLYVQSGAGEEFEAFVSGVFTDEDLVLLEIKGTLPAAKFSTEPLNYGRFITASQPSGKPLAFGVISVLERNLRETDQAHLGIIADRDFHGTGVRIENVQPDFGAAEAGLQSGDVILKIDERTISGLQELKNALTNKQPGDKLKVLIETAGKERTAEVLLSNRPMFGQFSGNGLNQMERMGGEPNLVRDGFSRVVQSDMKIKRNQVGGPVADLKGNIVGVTLARADRTRTYIMGGEAVKDLLKSNTDTIAEAEAKISEKNAALAAAQRELMAKMRKPGKPKSMEGMGRHLSDMDRLLRRLNQELSALQGNSNP